MIPVPRVQAWGRAASDTLGLGPFIMMDFINGVNLSDILKGPNVERPTRLMREDIRKTDIEAIYRQLANFLLQLFQLDFDRIGSLPSPTSYKTGELTHSVTEAKGLRQQQSIFNMSSEDWKQLFHQPNSTVGLYDAKNKYVAFKALKTLISDLINAKYDHYQFKLICDNIGFANLIVRSREEPTVIGVVNLEWTYIGPAQLFGSAPWWLLQDRPVNNTWDCNSDEPPKVAG